MQIGAVGSVLPSDLVGLTRCLSNTTDNVAAFPDAHIVAYLNQEYSTLQAFILSNVLNDWKENTVQGDGVGSINLVASVNKYAFPTNLLTLDRIEVNYTGNANDYRLVTVHKLNSIDRALSNTANNSAIKGTKTNPIAFLRDGYIYLDPIPDLAVSAGMLVWATIRKTDLAIGGTGDQLTPIFEPAYHELLAYGAAIKYLISKDNASKAGGLMQVMNARKAEFIIFLSTREQATRVGVRPMERSMR